MKYLFLSMVSTGLIFFTNLAKAEENFLFLNSDQFEHLTIGEQKIYIETLQNLIIQFETQKEFSPQVSTIFKNHPWIEGLISLAQAQTSPEKGNSIWPATSDVWTGPKERSNDNGIENSKISYALVLLDSRITATQDHKSEVIRANTRENFLDIYDRLKFLSKKNLDSEQRKNFNANLAGFREKYERMISIAPDLQKMRAEITQFTKNSAPLSDLSTAATPRPSSQSSGSTNKMQKKPGPPPPSSSAKSPDQTQTKAAPSEKADSSAAHCLYSGFVIRGSCTPLKVLPDALRLNELGQADFKCKSSNEILCNPLVFGYQADLSPYCTVRSRTASKNCQEISNNSDNLARLHKAWKNPANKKIFDDFQSSLKNLCDSNSRNSDVRSTCKVVVAQFNEKVKKEFPAQLTAGSSSDSKTNKSLKTN